MENSNRPQRPRIGKFDTPRRYTGDNFNKRKDNFSDSKNIVGDTNRRFERRSPRPTTGERQSFSGNSRSFDGNNRGADRRVNKRTGDYADKQWQPTGSGKKPYRSGEGRQYGERGNSWRPQTNRQNTEKKQKYHKNSVDMSLPMRLNKFIANSNICSRREADEFIQAGVVSVNGQVVTELGTKIVPATDKVHFHDQLVSMEKKIYILMNKPKNIITTLDDPKERRTVLDLIKNACSERVYPVGRLDRNTTGVLLITNDGDLTSKLIHPKYEKKKIYHVRLDREFESQDMEAIRRGIVLEDGDIKADDISYVKEDNKKEVGIEIHSGKNRIVRRMFEHLGYKIVALDRVYFAGLTKKNLPRGKWRYLSESEVNFLKMNSQ